MKIILCCLLGFIGANATPVESDVPAVEPEYLDQLLREENYEEFSYLLGLPDPKLAVEKQTDGSSELTLEKAMFHEELGGTDTLPFVPSTEEIEEEGRQAIKFKQYPSSKWQNKQVPYVYANNHFNNDERQRIENAISQWNKEIGDCIRLVPRNSQRDYVYISSGNGCFSAIGRRGNQQDLSLQRNRCLQQGTIIHEFVHAIGYAHEHNRQDRDYFVKVEWDNIPEKWKREYQKTNPNYYEDVRGYDYYSIMHYPYNAPETNKPAFEIKNGNIDKNRLGRGQSFTSDDLRRIRQEYC